MSTAIWDDLASLTRRSRREIEGEAAIVWLEQELRETDRGIAAYVKTYGVQSPEEIDALIRSGRTDDHPAWEDRIDWENVIFYREQLVKTLAEVGPVGQGR